VPCLPRRSILLAPAAVNVVTTLAALPASSAAARPNGLPLTTAPSSGLKWADAKVGTGQPLSRGAIASIDYSMASTAGRFPLIYTTKDTGAPYRWKLGDGSTIAGIEMAILGDEKDGVPPMLPGGIRRVVIPATLGFQALAVPNAKCEAGKMGSIGPIPPKDDLGAYQRWAQFYCNPRIPYQPDVILDVKLYGKR
jgi:FKBP-type peptidyl-prolyl cis-trans isomerase